MGLKQIVDTNPRGSKSNFGYCAWQDTRSRMHFAPTHVRSWPNAPLWTSSRVRRTTRKGLSVFPSRPNNLNRSCVFLVPTRVVCLTHLLGQNLLWVVTWAALHLLSSNFGNCAWRDGGSNGKGLSFQPFRQGEEERSGKGAIRRVLAKRPPLDEL